MRFHNYLTFINSCINAKQAKTIAAEADEELRQQSTCLYGRYEGNEWHDLSSYRKPGDTHVMLGYAGKWMRAPKPISSNE